MTLLALSAAPADSDPLPLAVAGTRIPRRACADVNELATLVAEARSALRAAHDQAESVRQQAREDGFRAGCAQAQAQSVDYLLRAQREARGIIDSAPERVVDLAVAIVAKIAPQVGEARMVAALAGQALRALQAERSLTVRVTPPALESVQAMLAQWRGAHPQITEARVVCDPELEPYGCVIESEFGRIEAGLPAQLELVREGLAAAQGARAAAP